MLRVLRRASDGRRQSERKEANDGETASYDWTRIELRAAAAVSQSDIVMYIIRDTPGGAGCREPPGRSSTRRASLVAARARGTTMYDVTSRECGTRRTTCAHRRKPSTSRPHTGSTRNVHLLGFLFESRIRNPARTLVIRESYP